MTRADFQLITLGRLALLPPPGGDDAGLNRQRRKLAVLAVLALSRAPVPRDLLVEMFWGDQDETRARHSLSDALSHLRRALGADSISLRHTEVRLSPGAPLRVDARELAEAVRAADHARALELHGGGFLESVFVGGSARFEQWVDEQARQVERQLRTACERRCEELAAMRAWSEREQTARRWLAADPLSADAALCLLTSVRSGGSGHSSQRARAEYAAYRRRLAEEFGVEPDAAVAAFAQSLEARAAVPPEIPAATATDAQASSSAQAAAEQGAASRDASEPHLVVTAAPGAGELLPARRTTRWSRPLRWAAAAGAALALVLLLAPLLRSDPAATPTAVAIFPFEVRGGAEYGFLREGMVDLLSTNLDGTGGLRTVDPRAVLAAVESDDAGVSTPEHGRALAERLGAATYVMGDVVEAGGRLRIAAGLYDVRRGSEPITRAYAEGNADSLFSVVDALTVALLAERAQGLGGRIVRTAALTTQSLPALKAYLEGERHWRALRLVEAVESLRRATQQDTGFALAWYRLGMASSWDARVEIAQDAMDRALRHSSELSERDRTLIAAYRDVVQRNPEQAERRYRAVVADYPTDVEAWAGLGEMAFHINPWRGGSFAESREAWEQVLRLEPQNIGATWHLAYVSARQGRHAEFDTLTRRIQATVAGGADLSVRAIRAVVLGDPREQAKVLADLAAADDFSLILAVWRVTVSTEDLAAIQRFVELLVQPHRPREVRALGHTLQATLLMARGQLRAAKDELAELDRLDPAQALTYRGLFALHPLQPAVRDTLIALRAQLRSVSASAPAGPTGPTGLWVNIHSDIQPQLRAYLIGLLSVHIGDFAEAERSATVLARTEGEADAGHLARSHARAIRAELLRRQGRPAQAIAALESARDIVDFGSARTSPFYARSRQRFVRGELLQGLGRDSAALGWYSGIGEIFPYDVLYLAPSHLRQAEILAVRGEHAAAAAHYRRFLALWSESDPELRRWRDYARERLALVSGRDD